MANFSKMPGDIQAEGIVDKFTCTIFVEYAGIGLKTRILEIGSKKRLKCLREVLIQSFGLTPSSAN